jgi:RHS repeat-associated protein
MLSQAPRDRDPFGFIGGLDAGSGLWKLGARFYNSSNGGFIQQDRYMGNPGDPLSLNRYVYCRLDPVNFIDPTGFDVGSPGTDAGSDDHSYDNSVHTDISHSNSGDTITVSDRQSDGSTRVSTYNYDSNGNYQGGTVTITTHFSIGTDEATFRNGMVKVTNAFIGYYFTPAGLIGAIIAAFYPDAPTIKAGNYTSVTTSINGVWSKTVVTGPSGSCVNGSSEAPTLSTPWVQGYINYHP